MRQLAAAFSFEGIEIAAASSDPYAQVLQISSALQGRDSKAQGASPGNMNEQYIEPCKGGIDAFCFALSGLYVLPSPTQGFGCFAAFTLGCDIPRFQRLQLFLAHNVLSPTSICS